MNRKNISTFVISLAIVLIVAEVVLRSVGYNKGVFRKIPQFSVVDSLVEYSNFTTDEFGIYKFSAWITDSVFENFDFTKSKITSPEVSARVSLIENFEYVYTSFYFLINKHETVLQKLLWEAEVFYRGRKGSGRSKNRRFEHFADTVLMTKADTNYKYLVTAYLKRPYNKEGFRSIPFEDYRGKKKKILMVGDSFVYGMSAHPFYNSFADILLTKDYVVYSAGIPGADPAQYAEIVRKYLPKLNPDVVVVCFYEGNDYMQFDRCPRVGQPYEYITNAGFFESAPVGNFMPAKECYNYYLSLISVPEDTCGFGTLATRSAIGSVLWGSAYALDYVQHPGLWEYNKRRTTDIDTTIENTRKHIVEINGICALSGVPLYMVVIPDNMAHYNVGRKFAMIDTFKANRLFSGISYYYPASLDLKRDFVGSNDYHFTNKGSEIFARYLEEILTNDVMASD